MVRSILTTGSLTLCWLYSPDSLVIAGNSIGTEGWYFLIPFLLAFVVSGWALAIIYRVTRHSTIGIQSVGHLPEKSRQMNYLISLSLTIGCCLGLVLFIPTSTLIRAGFIFNDTFSHSFPNYGFSLLLLAGVSLPHLWNEKLPVILQICFFGATLCCLIILTLFGLLSGQEYFLTIAENTPCVSDPLEIPASFWILFCTFILLFLGYDQGKSYLFSWKYRLLLLFWGALFIGLWCAVSLLHVPQTQLALSTIPYILGAQEILGDHGRVLIGITVICGAFSVVNGLFIITNRLIQQQLVSAAPVNPAILSLLTQRIYTILVSIIIIVLLLATNLAGAREEIFEMYIYGSLLLWLLHTAVRIHAGLHAFHKAGGKTARIHFFLPALLLFTFISLVLTHTQPDTLVLYLALVLTVSSSIAAAWLFYMGQNRNPVLKYQRRLAQAATPQLFG